MNLADADSVAPPRERLVLPCTESCAAFRPLKPDQWSEYGLCTNPRSRHSGYPVRLGRDCRDFVVSRAAIIPAS